MPGVGDQQGGSLGVVEREHARRQRPVPVEGAYATPGGLPLGAGNIGPVMPADGEASTEAGTPHALGQNEDVEYWNLGLDEAIITRSRIRG